MEFIIFESLLPVFIVIGVGLLLRKSALVPEPDWRGIELLGYWLLFPVLVFDSLVRMDLSGIDLGAITQAYLAAVLIQLALIWFLRGAMRQHLGLSDPTFSAVFQTSTRWNGFVALAIASKMAGTQGLALVALIIAITVPVLNVVNVAVLTVCTSQHKPTLWTTSVNTFKVPLIWAALLGLAVNLAGIPLYEPLLVSLDVVGRAGLGIGLLAVGAGIRLQAMRAAKLPVVVTVIAKLVIFPLWVYAGCLV
ncbi:MAG TPA: AEC family transporter [Gammaproteobacteria bacterium]|nr:AEC family transporter [Gammaproteobacteria bacterium]